MRQRNQKFRWIIFYDQILKLIHLFQLINHSYLIDVTNSNYSLFSFILYGLYLRIYFLEDYLLDHCYFIYLSDLRLLAFPRIPHFKVLISFSIPSIFFDLNSEIFKDSLKTLPFVLPLILLSLQILFFVATHTYHSLTCCCFLLLFSLFLFVSFINLFLVLSKDRKQN